MNENDTPDSTQVIVDHSNKLKLDTSIYEYDHRLHGADAFDPHTVIEMVTEHIEMMQEIAKYASEAYINHYGPQKSVVCLLEYAGQPFTVPHTSCSRMERLYVEYTNLRIKEATRLLQPIWFQFTNKQHLYNPETGKVLDFTDIDDRHPDNAW